MKKLFTYLLLPFFGFWFILSINGYVEANDNNFMTPYEITQKIVDYGLMTETAFNNLQGTTQWQNVLTLYEERNFFACWIYSNRIVYSFSANNTNGVNSKVFGRYANTTDNQLYRSLSFKQVNYNQYGGNGSGLYFNITNGSYVGSGSYFLSSNTELPTYVYSDLPINILNSNFVANEYPSEYPNFGFIIKPKFTLQSHISGSYTVLQLTLGDFENVDIDKISLCVLSNDNVGYLQPGDGLIIKNNRLFVETRRIFFNQSYVLSIYYNGRQW